MQLLKILLILILVILPFGELLRFDLGNNIRIKPLDILAGLSSICLLGMYFAGNVKNLHFKWYYFVFPSICLLSLSLNSVWLKPNELAASGLYLVRWLSYLGMLFVVMQIDSNFKKKVLSLLVIDGLLIVLLGFIQYFFYSDLKPLYYLGWDDHLYRLFSVFLDPNYTGGFFALYLLFVGGLLYKYVGVKKFHSSDALLYVPTKITRKQVILLLSVIEAISLLALFLTFSRSSLVMLIVGASVFFILIGKKKLILVLLGIIIVFTLIISSKFYVENINLFRQASSVARLGNYQDALTIVSNQPLLGIGFNAYRYAKDRYQMNMGWVKAPSHADAGVDNSFLFVLVTTGIVGLLAYLSLWFFVLKRAFLLYKKDANIFAIIVIASSFGIFVHALFINSLFFPAIMAWMWIMIGFMENKLR